MPPEWLSKHKGEAYYLSPEQFLRVQYLVLRKANHQNGFPHTRGATRYLILALFMKVHDPKLRKADPQHGKPHAREGLST